MALMFLPQVLRVGFSFDAGHDSLHMKVGDKLSRVTSIEHVR